MVLENGSLLYDFYIKNELRKAMKEQLVLINQSFCNGLTTYQNFGTGLHFSRIAEEKNKSMTEI